MNINYYSIGQRIRTLRIENHITQEDLAFQINTSAAYISNIENGKKKPSLQKLTEIADILGVTINDLLYSTAIPFHNSNDELTNALSSFPIEKQKQLLSLFALIIKSLNTK